MQKCHSWWTWRKLVYLLIAFQLTWQLVLAKSHWYSRSWARCSFDSWFSNLSEGSFWSTSTSNSSSKKSVLLLQPSLRTSQGTYSFPVSMTAVNQLQHWQHLYLLDQLNQLPPPASPISWSCTDSKKTLPCCYKRLVGLFQN